MTKEVLGKFEELMKEIIRVYKFDTTLEQVNKDGVLIPVLKNNGKFVSLHELIAVQDWHWFADDFESFKRVAEYYEVDMINLTNSTGVKGQTNAFISAESWEGYLGSLGKSTRKNLRKVYRKEYPLIDFKTATTEHKEEVRQLIFEDECYWKKDIAFGELPKRISDVYTTLGFGKHGRVRIGYYDSQVVCCYVWVEHKGIWRSMSVSRNREIPLQLGHIMQIDKVFQSIETGMDFDLGICNWFPHKVSWSTRTEILGGIGEGFYE